MLITNKVRSTAKQRYRVNKPLVLRKINKDKLKRIAALWNGLNEVFKGILAAAFLVWFFCSGYPMFFAWWIS